LADGGDGQGENFQGDRTFLPQYPRKRDWERKEPTFWGWGFEREKKGATSKLERTVVTNPELGGEKLEGKWGKEDKGGRG